MRALNIDPNAKVAVVTGASGGIGRALSIELLGKNHDMQVVAIGRNQAKLDEVVNAFPNRVTAIACDLTSTKEREALLTSLKALSQIDFLIHCAAMIHPLKQLSDISEDEWQVAQTLNIDVPLFMTTALLPKMKNGRVMFLTSDSELQPVVGAGPYCINKSALHMMWQCLKAEYQGTQNNIKNRYSSKSIHFGLVAPGNVDTSMQQAIRETDKAILPLAPLLEQAYRQGQLLKPEYVAQFLRWLLCEVDSEQYSQKIWNIYAELSHQNWLKA
ncbi:SDR family NAD(P)-dependent oxidoreductase [Alteromonadaceae bacterium M269]|nr:SDR family NAD(P)-dependent oxidoreductase [Alteromonadaceae bacterium M269]